MNEGSVVHVDWSQADDCEEERCEHVTVHNKKKHMEETEIHNVNLNVLLTYPVGTENENTLSGYWLVMRIKQSFQLIDY